MAKKAKSKKPAKRTQSEPLLASDDFKQESSKQESKSGGKKRKTESTADTKPPAKSDSDQTAEVQSLRQSKGKAKGKSKTKNKAVKDKGGKNTAVKDKIAKIPSSDEPKEQPEALEELSTKSKGKEKRNRKDKEGKNRQKYKQDKHRKLSLAEKADKFLCYQKSVQCPEHDASFFRQAYRDVNQKEPLSLREDFCGTFAVCCEWVAENSKRTAVGVDLCAETLQWGREHNLSRLKPKQQAQIRLLEQDVRVKNLPAVDVLAAQNFSFWIFQTRPEAITYLRAARENLKPGGIMVLDMMGGADCYREGSEDKKVIGKGKKKFNYYWKQVSFNPANNQAKFSISFRFRDGSKLENAFEYDWRFWTIPDVREMLMEAGFTSTRVYFENEEDDSIWESREHAPSHPVWLAYIVAVR